jgi:hypothetical protein
MKAVFAVALLLIGFTPCIGTYLYTATPEINPLTIFLMLFVLSAVLLAVPAGFVFSVWHYGVLVLIAAVLVFSVPVLLRNSMASLACSTHGRTPVANLIKAAPGEQVTFCGVVETCTVTALAGDGSLQEVCVMRDAGDRDAAIVFYNYTLLDDSQSITDPQTSAAQRELTMIDNIDDILVRAGRYEPELYIACAVPDVCARQPLPFGEVYSSPAIFERVR